MRSRPARARARRLRDAPSICPNPAWSPCAPAARRLDLAGQECCSIPFVHRQNRYADTGKAREHTTCATRCDQLARARMRSRLSRTSDEAARRAWREMRQRADSKAADEPGSRGRGCRGADDDSGCARVGAAAMHTMHCRPAALAARQDALAAANSNGRAGAQPRYERLGNDGHASAEPAAPVSETPGAALPRRLHGLPAAAAGRVAVAPPVDRFAASSQPQSSLTQVDANQQAPVQTTSGRRGRLGPRSAIAAAARQNCRRLHTTPARGRSLSRSPTHSGTARACTSWRASSPRPYGCGTHACRPATRSGCSGARPGAAGMHGASAAQCSSGSTA